MENLEVESIYDNDEAEGDKFDGGISDDGSRIERDGHCGHGRSENGSGDEDAVERYNRMAEEIQRERKVFRSFPGL
jgi:hypothetical protein